MIRFLDVRDGERAFGDLAKMAEPAWVTTDITG
jgi:hypothetical protein